MTQRKAFCFRMKPNAMQREALARMAGARRYVWNWALAQCKAHYLNTGKSLPAAELSTRLTALVSFRWACVTNLSRPISERNRPPRFGAPRCDRRGAAGPSPIC